MTTEIQTEAQAEAALAAVLQQVQSGEVPDVVDDPVVDEPEPDAIVTDEPDPEEVRARADGHVSYDEWVAAGKDPRAWRPAAEYNRRGDLLKTPKPELIERLEQVARNTEAQAKLMAEQIRISQEAQKAAFIAGKEEAIRQAREEADAAFNVGDRKAHTEALAKEQQATQEIIAVRTPAPVADPELVTWQEGAKWFTEGFDERNQPKNIAVETFLTFQKDYMLRNPSARVVDSVKFAEGKVKAAMPDFFKPKTPQARTTAPAVASGTQTARNTADPLLKFPAAERDLIKRAAKEFGKSVPDYIKMIEG